MNQSILYTALLGVPALVLSSCGECPADLTAKQCNNIIEAGDVCQLYSNGKISAKDAVKQLDELTRRYKAISQKLTLLMNADKNTPEQQSERESELRAYEQSTEAKVSKQKMQRARNYLKQVTADFYSGKETSPEVIAAIARYNAAAELFYI